MKLNTFQLYWKFWLINLAILFLTAGVKRALHLLPGLSLPVLVVYQAGCIICALALLHGLVFLRFSKTIELKEYRLGALVLVCTTAFISAAWYAILDLMFSLPENPLAWESPVFILALLSAALTNRLESGFIPFLRMLLRLLGRVILRPKEPNSQQA